MDWEPEIWGDFSKELENQSDSPHLLTPPPTPGLM